MEPTARLEVTLLDPEGKPGAGATVQTWPNIHFGDWGATIFGECYNTSDYLQKARSRPNRWGSEIPIDFAGNSNSNGLAVVPNVRADVNPFAVEHADFQQPGVDVGGGEKRRKKE